MRRADPAPAAVEARLVPSTRVIDDFVLFFAIWWLRYPVSAAHGSSVALRQQRKHMQGETRAELWSLPEC
jgi:hypothetical protein